jgi:hypothetical protein
MCSVHHEITEWSICAQEGDSGFSGSAFPTLPTYSSYEAPTPAHIQNCPEDIWESLSTLGSSRAWSNP